MLDIIRSSRNKEKVLIVAQLKLFLICLRGGCLCIQWNCKARIFYKPGILVFVFAILPY